MLRKTMVSLLVVVAVLALSGRAMAAKVGERGQTDWQGKAYDIEVMKVKGDQCYIHWTGWEKKWDEWRACSQLRIGENKAGAAATQGGTPGAAYSEGDAVKVNWKGSWYPAHVIGTNAKKGTYKIHYDGYDSSWDEWVTVARMKK